MQCVEGLAAMSKKDTADHIPDTRQMVDSNLLDAPTTVTIQRDWLNKLLEEAYTITTKLECGENIEDWETARLVGYIQSAQFLLDKQSVNNAH